MSKYALIEYPGKKPYQIYVPGHFVVCEDPVERVWHVYYYKGSDGEARLLTDEELRIVDRINGFYDPEEVEQALRKLETEFLGNQPNEILVKILEKATAAQFQLQLRLLDRRITNVYDTFIKGGLLWVFGISERMEYGIETGNSRISDKPILLNSFFLPGKEDDDDIINIDSEAPDFPVNIYQKFNEEGGLNIKDVCCAGEFTVVLTADNKIWMCNIDGIHEWTEYVELKVVRLFKGADYAIALTDMNRLICIAPTRVDLLNLGEYANINISSVSGGHKHIAILTTDGHVLIITIKRPKSVFYEIEEFSTPTLIENIPPISKLSCFNENPDFEQPEDKNLSPVMITTDGRLVAMNNGTPIYLFDTRFSNVTCGSRKMILSDTQGKIWISSGLQPNSLLVKSPPTGTDYDFSIKYITLEKDVPNFTQIDCGGYQFAGITADGEVWTWGDNKWGSLGKEGYLYDDPPSPITTLIGPGSIISCGFAHTAVITLHPSIHL